MNEKEELNKLVDQFSEARIRFEMEVEIATTEVIAIAKQISPAIGEVSITEAKDVIIKEFIRRLNGPFYHGTFQGKKR